VRPTTVAGEDTLAAATGLVAIYERQAVAAELSALAAGRLAVAQERIADTLAAWAYCDVIEPGTFVETGSSGYGDIKGRARVKAVVELAAKAPGSAKSTRP
jgi:hypothetical protein